MGTVEKTVYYKGYVIEYIPHRGDYRVYQEESPTDTVAYEDCLFEAKTRIDELPPAYCGSEDGFEVEFCQNCENEIELKWDINKFGFQAVCPICGNRLMLCDACTHRHGTCIQDCTYRSDIDRCMFSRPTEWWKDDR